MWSRTDVPYIYCVCPSLPYKHAHCPCELCRGKAVSRATEFRHWSAAKREIEVSPPTVYGGQGSGPNSMESESPTPTTNAHDSSIDGMRGNDTTPDPSDESTTLGLTTADLQPASTITSMDTANTHAPLNTEAQPITGNGNVLSCVVEAIELMEDVDGSQEDFLNITRSDG